MKVVYALSLMFAHATCFGQSAPDPEPDRGGEPVVKHTVIEDDGSRIEELRVRGQTQRVTVTSKVGGGSTYEIIMGNAGRNPVAGTGGATSAVGKSVWSLMKF